MKTIIVTDSTAYLTPEERSKHNIYMLPLSVHLEDGTFDEETMLPATEFYDKVRHAKQFPKTTQPSVGKFAELYEQLGKEYDAIISIHLSSGISGTFSGAVQAAGMVENVKVFPYDSEIAAYPQGMFVLHAAKLAALGMPPEEIIKSLDDLKLTMDAYFIVEDLAHLQRGGRLSATAAIIGGILQVKPVLHFQNKVIVPFEKIRTRKKALKCAEEQLRKAVEVNPNLQAVVIHANCSDDADEWLAHLRDTFPTVTFHKSYFGAVIGTHLGEGSIAIGWMKKA